MVTTKKTKIALVYPPFGPPNLPSLGLANLSAGLKKLGFHCDTYYWNYRFLHNLPLEENSAKLKLYGRFGLGWAFPWNEYAFMRCVSPEKLSARDDEVAQIFAEVGEQYQRCFNDDISMSKGLEYLWEHAEEIVAAMGDDLEPYDVVGIGSTFYQNGPALALASDS